LDRAGFVDVQAITHIEVVRPDDPGRFMSTMIVGAHLDRLPPELHEGFVQRVTEEMEHPREMRYVRLTLSARRATIGA
jgi:trans-aconitate 2-methyltransferase